MLHKLDKLKKMERFSGHKQGTCSFDREGTNASICKTVTKLKDFVKDASLILKIRGSSGFVASKMSI